MALSIGAIIGITAGCAVAVIIIIVVAFVCVYIRGGNEKKVPTMAIVSNGQPVHVPAQNGVRANGHVHKIIYTAGNQKQNIQRPANRMQLQSFKFEPSALTTREKVGSLTYDLPYRRVQHASFVRGASISGVPQSPTETESVVLRTPRDLSPNNKVAGFGVVAIKSDGGEHLTSDGQLEKKKIRYTYRPEAPLPGQGSNPQPSPRNTPWSNPAPDRLSHVIQATPFTKVERVQHSPTSPSKTSFRSPYISVPEPIRETIQEGYVVHPTQGALRVTSGSHTRY